MTYSLATDFGGSFSSDALMAEIQDADITPNLTGIGKHGDNVTINFDAALSGPEQTTLDTVVTDHGFKNNKHLRKLEVDNRTQELIFEGFTHASKQFSLSVNAQINWTNAGLNATALTYPYRVSTLDDEDFHDFADSTEMQTAYGTALGIKASHLSSGASLKVDIGNAVDQAALDAITDTR